MRYLVHRTLLLVPTALAAVTVVFVALRLVPGDAVSLLVADQSVTPAAAERLRDRLGLNDPVPVQYGRFLGDLVRGDLGRSLWSGNRVAPEFAARLPVTLELALLAAAASAVLGLGGGVLAAVFQNRWPDYALRGVAVAGLSLPGFWLGTLAIVLPAIWWNSTPALTYVSPRDDLAANLRQFLTPALLMSLSLSAALLRLTRSLLLDVLHEDFVRVARAKGLGERAVVLRHALRATLPPLLTVFGNQFAVLLGGTVLFERIFNLQGVGAYLFQAVSQRDYPVIQAVNVYLALAVLLVNLCVDVAHGALDPRARAAG